VELEESAEIDGAGRLRILSSIFVPLVKPGVVTVVILNYISIWNEFLFALILLDQKSRTVQVAVSVLKGERLTDYGMLAAGVLISILPIIVVFLFFQRKIIGGLYSGAIKG
jgi:multiple sugar transport system permease protein